MKTKTFFFLSVFFLFSVFMFLSTHSLSQQASYGFYNNYYRIILNNGSQHTYSYFSGLNLNAWHNYTKWFTGTDNGWTDWTNTDVLTANILFYGTPVGNILSTNAGNSYRTIMDRVKINRLCYGQRSEYQCEEGHINSNYYFYAYENHSGYDSDYQDNTYAGGNWVRYCPKNSTNMGDNPSHFVVTGLKANREQVNIRAFSHVYEADWMHNFYIKPSIRIPTGLADGTEICKIYIKDWNGNNAITPVILKAENFKVHNGGLNYLGGYIEEFNWQSNPEGFFINNTGNSTNYFNPDGKPIHEQGCEVDIQVEWLGNCDMWIDYVRVDDDVADQLFKGAFETPTNNWFEWEAGLAETGGDNGLKFYIEEFEFNNIPCIKYVNDQLMEYSDGKYKVMCCMNGPEYCRIQLKNLWNGAPALTKEFVKATLLDAGGLDEFCTFSYPFVGYVENAPDNPMGGRGFGEEVYIPNTLPVHTGDEGNGILALSTDAGAYDEWLQGYLDEESDPLWNQYFISRMKFADEVSKLADKPFVNLVQTHLWYENFAGGLYDAIREPTNEEMEMMVNISVTYGARAQFYFTWGANGDIEPSPDFYFRGLAGTNSTPNNYPRIDNVYEQYTGSGSSKIGKIGEINNKLQKWGHALMSFNNTDRKSYIYRLERTDMINETYFKDVVSYLRGGENPCPNDNPDTLDAPKPDDLRSDCIEDRYLQVATFKGQSGDYNKYFMVVNRRCSPLQSNHNDGERYIRVFFDQNHSDFAGYNNWAIYDLGTTPETYVGTFNKTSTNSYVDLKWFNPGEGKLYKIVPSVVKGGALVADEVISGQSFTCENTIISNGHNITINGGSTISFTDSATIIMNGGTFTSGSLNEGTSQTTYKGIGTGKWNGLQLNNCTVKIYNSKFQDISSPVINYAIKMLNCPLGDIRTNEFVMSSDTSGAVQSVYTTSDGETSFQCLYIAYNNITMNNSRANGVMVQGFSGLTLPVYIMNNTMTSNGYAGGVMLSSVTGGSVKNNSVTGFSTGINTLLSTVNVFNNIITNTTAQSNGILVTGSASLSLVPSGGLWLGGFNTVTNTGGTSVNLQTDNSVFDINNGSNTFEVNTTDPESYHLYGSFWDNPAPDMFLGNCFKIDGTEIGVNDEPAEYLTSSGLEVDMKYGEYVCGPSLPEGQTIVDLGGGLYDTIPGSGGEGAGFSSINNYELRISNLKAKTKNNTLAQFTLLTPKAMYDTVRVRLAKQNYAGVKSACYDLINAYPDSMQSIMSLQTLYLSAIMTDTTYAGISQLKTFYQTLILEHPDNTAMVRISNYMAQKCKVMLKEYSSALSGFQQIINSNPYSYEGLAAKWDYMATSLLAPQGGAMSNDKAQMTNEYSVTEISDFGPEISDLVHNSQLEIRNPQSEGDDKSPFTKEQKQQIHSTIKNAYEQARNDDEIKIKTLEERSEGGDINSAKELKQMQTLKQLVKTEKPRNITEHISIVSSDAQKVFGNTQPTAQTKTTAIPEVFSLSQNFPNPFNPVTTIKYALPKDVKVVVKIYDILGREVKTLVNQLQTAGYYDLKFDMSSYASGVYFYRIEVRQAGSSTVDFVQSKKMVLVK